ncbi:MAG: glycerophosphodiester phosphodiesterase family protein [Pseudomonadota bacterium]
MSPFKALALTLALSSVLAACDGAPGETNITASNSVTLNRLPDMMDCVRDMGGMLISAHRGGPTEGFAENGLETLKHGYSRGLRVFEIDVSRSKDGVLFLLHDRTLQRTTTGSGAAINWDMDEIEYLQLVDNSGQRLDEAPPRLDAVLSWAVENDAIVQLDRKDPVEFGPLIRAVRNADAENNTVLISYNDGEAKEIARLAPEMMMTASVNSRDHQTELESAGVNFAQVVAWTGTRSPHPAAWRALGRRGIESSFGTLGRPETRLDTRYVADGDLSEYQNLADDGLHILSTDEPYAVADYLTVDDRTLESCWQ